MLPAVAKQLGPELTAYFTLQQAYRDIKVAHNDARIRLIFTKGFFYSNEKVTDLASLHAYVAQEEKSLWRKFPNGYA